MTVLALHTGGLGDLLVAAPPLLSLALAVDEQLEIRGRSEFLPALARVVAPRKSPAREPILFPFERPGVHRLFVEDGFDPEAAPPDLAEAIARASIVVSFLGLPGGALERNCRALGARAVATVAVPRRDAQGPPRATARVRDAIEAATGRELGEPEPLAIDARAEDATVADALLDRAGLSARGFLLLHPGSGGATKNWPLERFLEVARRAESALGLGALAVTGPADEAIARRLASGAPEERVPRVDGPPIGVLVALLARARAYLGNDSGVSHLAAAAGARGVAVFGPSDPAVWAPDSPRIATLHAGADPAAVSVDDVLGSLAAAL